MMLTLLALALPTAALAKSFRFDTGTFISNVNSSIPTRTSTGGFGTAGANFRVGVVGSMNFIMLGGTVLGAGCNTNDTGNCTFSLGTVTVRTAPGGTVLFTDSLNGGTIHKTNTTAIITANLVPSAAAGAPLGGSVTFDVSFGGTAPFNDRLTGGKATVSIVPEPGTLLSFGTGLIGLAGMMRRRLKLGA
jgi:hypothetical protein